jgi:hypothetical protein
VRVGDRIDVIACIQRKRLIDWALEEQCWRKEREDIKREDQRLMSEILSLARQGLRPIGVRDLEKCLHLNADHGVRLLRYMVAERVLNKTDLKPDVIAAISLKPKRSQRLISRDMPKHGPEEANKMIVSAAQVIAESTQPPGSLVSGLKRLRSRIYTARNSKPVSINRLRSGLNRVQKAANRLLNIASNEKLRSHLLGGSPPSFHKEMKKIHDAAKTLLEMLQGDDVHLLVHILVSDPSAPANDRRDALAALPNVWTAIPYEEGAIESLKFIVERAKPLSIGGKDGRPKKTIKSTQKNAFPLCCGYIHRLARDMGQSSQ